MDNQAREYRYQKSWTIGNEMFVVRCDDWKEFVESYRNMESILPETKAFPDDTPGKHMATSPQEVVHIPMCGIHNVPMVWVNGGVSKSTGKPYAGFWSCKSRGPNGEYCKYKPGKGTQEA